MISNEIFVFTQKILNVYYQKIYRRFIFKVANTQYIYYIIKLPICVEK